MARGQHRGVSIAQEIRDAIHHDCAGIFASRGQIIFAGQRDLVACLIQHRAKGLFDIIRLTFFNQQNRFLAFTEFQEFRIDQRVGNIQHIQWYGTVAMHIGQTQTL